MPALGQQMQVEVAERAAEAVGILRLVWRRASARAAGTARSGATGPSKNPAGCWHFRLASTSPARVDHLDRAGAGQEGAHMRAPST